MCISSFVESVAMYWVLEALSVAQTNLGIAINFISDFFFKHFHNSENMLISVQEANDLKVDRHASTVLAIIVNDPGPCVIVRVSE